MDDTPLPHKVEDCLRDLAVGDDTARERILELCQERLRHLTQRMLRGFPLVKRWEDTDDVYQNAMLRLYRCLGEVTIESPREIMALAATQIHRELIDLARHHAGPMSFGANHATGSHPIDDHSNSRHPQDARHDTATTIDRWTRFHQAVEMLSPNKKKFFSWSGTSEQTRKQLRILWGALSAPSKVAGVEHARASVQPSTTNLPNNERSLELYC